MESGPDFKPAGVALWNLLNPLGFGFLTSKTDTVGLWLMGVKFPTETQA